MGIIAKPAEARATAPVSRFVVLLKRGRAELAAPFTWFGSVPRPAEASLVRRAFRPPKYNADPAPVRSAEGTVPRHSVCIGEEDEAISLSVLRSGCL